MDHLSPIRCLGGCGKWLTDPVSRMRKYGPECDPWPDRRKKIRRPKINPQQQTPDLLDELAGLEAGNET